MYIAVIAVCGFICEHNRPTAIHRWAKQQTSWLVLHLVPPNGIPLRDYILSLVHCAEARSLSTLLPVLDQRRDSRRFVAIDGKTYRGSHDKAKALGPLYIVSAWADEEGIALGQVVTNAKSNEITAIPQLLEQIDLADMLITIDAMGCQAER